MEEVESGLFKLSVDHFFGDFLLLWGDVLLLEELDVVVEEALGLQFLGEDEENVGEVFFEETLNEVVSEFGDTEHSFELNF